MSVKSFIDDCFAVCGWDGPEPRDYRLPTMQEVNDYLEAFVGVPPTQEERIWRGRDVQVAPELATEPEYKNNYLLPTVAQAEAMDAIWQHYG